MQLILSVLRDEKLLETVTLTAPKEASFGRQCAVGRADKQFNDDRLSRLHFRICPEGANWRLEDLRSRNGTKVQGKLVNVCILNDGDVISAGKLTFRVNLAGVGGAPGRTTDSAQQTPVGSSTLDPDGAFEVAAMAIRGRLKMNCFAEQGESGQGYFRGDFGARTPAELLLAFRQSRTLKNPWLILDQSRFETPLPEPLAAAAKPIVDWLGPEYAESVSPRLIGIADVPYPDWEAFINDAWGQDVLYVIFSDRSEAELLQILRKSARQGKAIAGILWPSVMSYMLLKGHAGPASEVMAGGNAILIELPDFPESWQLVGPATLQRNLEKLGFSVVAPTIETAPQTE